jgi:hypothetical protein
MKTNIYNEDKDRNATTNELARAIMNAAVECAIESTICDFEYDPSLKGKGLANLTEEQKEAVLEAMHKLCKTLWPKKSNDYIDFD